MTRGLWAALAALPVLVGAVHVLAIRGIRFARLRRRVAARRRAGTLGDGWQGIGGPSFAPEPEGCSVDAEVPTLRSPVGTLRGTLQGIGGPSYRPGPEAVAVARPPSP